MCRRAVRSGSWRVVGNGSGIPAENSPSDQLRRAPGKKADDPPLRALVAAPGQQRPEHQTRSARRERNREVSAVAARLRDEHDADSAEAADQASEADHVRAAGGEVEPAPDQRSREQTRVADEQGARQRRLVLQTQHVGPREADPGAPQAAEVGGRGGALRNFAARKQRAREDAGQSAGQRRGHDRVPVGIAVVATAVDAQVQRVSPAQPLPGAPGAGPTDRARLSHREGTRPREGAAGQVARRPTEQEPYAIGLGAVRIGQRRHRDTQPESVQRRPDPELGIAAPVSQVGVPRQPREPGPGRFRAGGVRIAPDDLLIERPGPPESPPASRSRPRSRRARRRSPPP